MHSRPLRTFLSYAHDNQGHRDKLKEHVAQLEREGLIRIWDDEELPLGGVLNAEIRKRLEESEVFILLVSPEFIASDYCSTIEMKHALERHAAGKALVFPIILSPCDWKSTALAHLVVAPRDGKPILTWKLRDAGWADATERIRVAVSQFRLGRGAPRRSVGPWSLGAVASGVIALGAWGIVSLKSAPQAGTSTPSLPDAGPMDAGSTPVVLVVDAVPGARIALTAKGKVLAVGKGSVRASVAPGPLKLEVSGAREVTGCSGEVQFLRRESFTVEPSPAVQKHAVRLDAGTLRIRTVPESHVAVEGIPCGETPLELTMYEGIYRASFECDGGTRGCAKAIRKLTVVPGVETDVSFLLP